MLVSEEELPIEIAQVDGIEVNDVDFAEAGEDKVLEKFASDPSSTYHENASLWGAISIPRNN